MRRRCFSEIPESLDVFNSEATSNSNFNGLSSLGGNWLSACEGDALTDSEVSTDLSVDDGGSVTICSPVDCRHICSFRGLVILNFVIS